MIRSVGWDQIPSVQGNRLYLDYINQSGHAAEFYPSGPRDFAAALDRRRSTSFPRATVADLLAAYNTSLGADVAAVEAARDLADADTYCVIGGQQAEFMGGPVFTTYKIVTTIRLARYLSEALGLRVVPLFWLASDDHDFGEISHVQFLQPDGEVGRVRFAWSGQGRPIADMPITREVLVARDAYNARLATAPHAAHVPELYAPAPGDDYSTWHARVWSRLFSHHGLVVVEPRALRAACGAFFASAIGRSGDVDERLREVTLRLHGRGYTAALTSELAGHLFTIGNGGRRVRLRTGGASAAEAEAHPELYAADAALRPVLADSLLPVLANVLGAGEIAYHAMLAPLYDLFAVPQPLLFPRKHYTVLSSEQDRTLRRYLVDAEDVLTNRIDVDAAFSRLAPAGERTLFRIAREQTEAALLPLRAYVADVDPGLDRTWEGTLGGALKALDKLEERALRSRLAQLGLSKHELTRLRNAILPTGRLQERVLPLPHFLAHHGLGFIEALFGAGQLTEFAHHLLTLDDGSNAASPEDTDARR